MTIPPRRKCPVCGHHVSAGREVVNRRSYVVLRPHGPGRACEGANRRYDEQGRYVGKRFAEVGR